MKRRKLCRAFGALAGVWLIAASGDASAQDPQPEPPSEVWGPLFRAVQADGVFPDSKTFADAVPRRPPADILADYGRGEAAGDLRGFVERNFELPGEAPGPPLAVARPPLEAHIAALWPALSRPPLAAPPNGSALSLRYPYVVPGGRFREVYYWDSYFTALGLAADGRGDLVRGLTDNFADLIGRYGHVPNGARSYYLSRSQPPVFYLMTALADPRGPMQGHATYLAALRAEHRFWMRGEREARAGHPVQHVVRLADGSLLNRYWDASDAPRDESQKEDLALAARAGRPPAELYRELRSAAESGWDFSSRWMADGRALATVQTTAIAPVDLNSLLFGLEQAIADGCGQVKDRACVRDFTARARARQRAVDRHLWDAARGEYLDLDWRSGHRLDRLSAAMLYPLFTGLASSAQARAVASATRARLLAPGGLRTTTVRTGQQWDAPNGWAPLQWVAVSGLRRYGERDLADVIADRWLATVCRTYAETGKLLEKYDVEEVRPGGGGEYPLQDGFGWTNGVVRALAAGRRGGACGAAANGAAGLP